ncbi:MAG: hypothetical protein K6F62_03175 [Schwartzia sp.]|nr:hypothetical protein [Schwartzia sp. (in: firmicutes)]
MEEPFWASFTRAFVGVGVCICIFAAIYITWTDYQLRVFRDEVQAVLDSGKGMDSLRLIDDWRVDNITDNTKRVSRADGHYVVFVWYLPSGRYLVDTVDR